MFETIVLALDGSSRSDIAVDAVADLAGSESHVVAVHVKTQATQPGQEAVIAEQLDRLRAAGLSVDLERSTTVRGDEANVVARAARRHEADAIVAAGRGYAPLHGLMAGSVTQRLVHLAPCPVLVIPPHKANDVDQEAVVEVVQ